MRSEPKVNVIIPNYNRGKDILECVESIRASTYFNLDILVVDDCSTDKSVDTLKNKGIRVIRHDRNRGSAATRNTGAKNTNGEIIVFIDSDVAILKDTIEKFVKILQSDDSISAVVALPDKENKYKGFFTQHFIMRVYYNYINLPDFIIHTNGTATAIRRSVFNLVGGYNELLKAAGVEDDEFGFDLHNKGKQIYLDKDNAVVHNKRINFFGLLKNDMLRTMDRVFFMFRKSQLNSVLSEKRFISTPMAHIISAILAPLIVVSFTLIFFSEWFLFLFLLLLLFFYSLYLGYLSFVLKEKGIVFAIKIFFLLIIDMFFVHIALWLGVILYICGRRY